MTKRLYDNKPLGAQIWLFRQIVSVVVTISVNAHEIVTKCLLHVEGKKGRPVPPHTKWLPMLPDIRSISGGSADRQEWFHSNPPSHRYIYQLLFVVRFNF